MASPPSFDDLPFDEPLDLRLLEGRLRDRLKAQRAHHAANPPEGKIMSEVRLAECRYPAEVLAMMEPIAQDLADRAGFVILRRPVESSELLLEFSLLPVDPRAAPLTIRTGVTDYVTMDMGVAGEIEFFGRGDDRAAQIVWNSIEPCVRAVVAGGLREVFWVDLSGGTPYNSKTHLLVAGKWRRMGAVGVRGRGERIEREYAPYRPEDPTGS